MNNQNPYNHPPMGQMMPPPQMEAPRPRGWRERWMQRFGMNGSILSKKKELTMPNWIVGPSIVAFFIALSACSFVWGYSMDFRYVVVASISVVLFFYGCKTSATSWIAYSERHFIRNVFILGLVIRLIWVLYNYYIFNPEQYGNTYGSGADVDWYIPFGQDIAQWVMDGMPVPFSTIIDRNFAAIDDVGYPIWLGIIYLIVGIDNDVFVPLVVKCITGAYCAICIYRIARRHYGIGVARMASLFIALNSNMIYWCASMMKEAEMVFLCCLCIELIDRTFTSGEKMTFKSLLPGILVGAYIFFYRAPLAIVLFLAMFAHIVIASQRVMSAGKKVIAGIMVTIVLIIGIGDRLRTQTERIMDSVENNDEQQRQNAEWRSKREGGNTFALYASRAVFAPLIFTIPFPTFNEAHSEQVAQQQTSGGSYIKNILSYFVLIVMIMAIISGEWRRHVFLLAYTLGYLVTLVLSNYAHSGRFHMPIWPMLMLFAAYGIQIAKTNTRIKRWFPMVLVIEIIACLVWNWFKLKGRGMI